MNDTAPDLEPSSGEPAEQNYLTCVYSTLSLQSCQSLSDCDLRKHLIPVTGPLTSNSASTELAVTRGDSLIRCTSISEIMNKVDEM